MPMTNWNEISNGNLEYIRRNPRKGGEVYKKDDDVWLVLYDEFIVAFGHNDAAMKIRKHQHNIAKLQSDFILDSKRYSFNKTLINLEYAHIEEIEKGMRAGMTIHQANVYVSKFMDARGMINFKTISVFDYYTILKEFNNHNKQLRKDGKANK
jgi:hypothetical protein